MPWDSTNGIMTAPVGMGDISAAVGNTSGDLGTLITSGTINKWARYKPIQHSAVGFVTEAQRRAANFGISASEYSIPQLAAEPLNGWTYARPTTGYFRMADFVKMTDAGVASTTTGYTTREVAPCRGFAAASSTGQLTHYVYNTGAQVEDAINFYAITTGAADGIGFAEMGGLADWYLCIAVAVVKNNVTTTYIVTSTQKIGAGVDDPTVTAWQTVPIPKDNTIFSGNATYTAYACLCDTKVSAWTDYTQAVAHGSAKFMPVPVTDPSIATFNFQVFSGSYSAWVGSAYRLTTSGTIAERRKVWYSLYFMNDTGQTIPSSALTITLELYAYANGVRTDLGSTVYSSLSTPTSALADTGGQSQLLESTGNKLGNQHLPSYPNGSIHIDVIGTDSQGTTVFSSSTQVADDPTPFID